VLNSALGGIAGLLSIPFQPLDLLPVARRGADRHGLRVSAFHDSADLHLAGEDRANLYEAAADLYANAFRTFWRVTVPLSMPGVVAGTILTFVPVIGTFVVSDILGGRQVILVGNLVQRQFLDARNPPFGSAASIILLVMTLALTLYYTRRFGWERRSQPDEQQKQNAKRSPWLTI
jgi:ABC-type Fe3+ transport system permease subunit